MMYPNAMKFQDRLRWLRRHKKVTQRQAAEVAGITNRLWGSYELGNISPGTRNLCKIAKALPNANLHWLITGKGEPLLGEVEP